MDDLLTLFGILSDKTRLRILLLLIEKELCVCEIFATLDMSQPRVSRQLSILKQAKLIKDRRDGKWIYYKIDKNIYANRLMSILSLVPEWLEDDLEFKNDKAMFHKISKLKDQFENCDCVLLGGEKHGE